MEWKVIGVPLPESTGRSTTECMLEILNGLEKDGWEPRQIDYWTRNSVADMRGVTIYSRKVADTTIDAALRLIHGDPHQWSERPCATCRSVSDIVGKPFGCVLYTIAQKGVQRDDD